MITVTQAFLDAQKVEEPLALLFLQSRIGRRVYGVHTPTHEQMGSSGGLIVYDGTATIGDDTVFGSTAVVIDWGDLALSFGSLRETLTPDGADLLTSLAGSEIPNMSFTLNNTEGDFSEMLTQESFLGQAALLRVGYPSLAYQDWLTVYTGVVSQQTLTQQEFAIQTTAGQLYSLYETVYLGKASRYTTPENDTDILPVVYGDNRADHGVWKTVCIDTVNFHYFIADHAILSVANGNTVRVFDSDKNEMTTGYTLYTSGTDENGDTIAYLDFTADPEGDIYVSAKGKADSGVLIDNPVDILTDLLDLYLPDVLRNASAFATARMLAEQEALTAGGILLQDQPPASYLQSLCASFLADWWTNAEGEILVSFDAVSESTYNIAGFLVHEAEYTDDPTIEESLDNICNQAAVYYAKRYTTIDRRTTSGARLGEYDGFDDGTATKDALSQVQYGVQQREFQLDWVRSAAVAAVIQAQIITRYKDPLHLVTLTENAFVNAACTRGDYVVGSVGALRDEEGLPLKNQIWKVLEIDKHYDNFTIGYFLQDTGQYWAEPPIVYDGTSSIGSYPGRVRDRRDLR